jgi:hypothetical protein
MCFGAPKPTMAAAPPPPPLPPVQQVKPARVDKGQGTKVIGKKGVRRRGSARKSMVIDRPTGVNLATGGVGVYSG